MSLYFWQYLYLSSRSYSFTTNAQNSGKERKKDEALDQETFKKAKDRRVSHFSLGASIQ